MFLGFAGEGFKQEGEALLKPGEQFTFPTSRSSTMRSA